MVYVCAPKVKFPCALFPHLHKPETFLLIYALLCFNLCFDVFGFFYRLLCWFFVCCQKQFAVDTQTRCPSAPLCCGVGDTQRKHNSSPALCTVPQVNYTLFPFPCLFTDPAKWTIGFGIILLSRFLRWDIIIHFVGLASPYTIQRPLKGPGPTSPSMVGYLPCASSKAFRKCVTLTNAYVSHAPSGLFIAPHTRPSLYANWKSSLESQQDFGAAICCW